MTNRSALVSRGSVAQGGERLGDALPVLGGGDHDGGLAGGEPVGEKARDRLGVDLLVVELDEVLRRFDRRG